LFYSTRSSTRLSAGSGHIARRSFAFDYYEAKRPLLR
jgi:hypothetical protein